MTPKRYQLCRWYDQHPQLVFALQLLRLAPQEQQQQLIDEVFIFLELTELPDFTPHTSIKHQSTPKHSQQRWYDQNPSLSLLMETLRKTPNILRIQAIELILSQLKKLAA